MCYYLVEVIIVAYNDVLVYLRKREGLSQTELAKRTGLTRSAISMYETGRREPDLETFEIFADFYNVDMNTIMGQPEKNSQLTDAQIDDTLLSLLTELTPDEIPIAVAYIQGIIAARKG